MVRKADTNLPNLAKIKSLFLEDCATGKTYLINSYLKKHSKVQTQQLELIIIPREEM
jgi:hypothetical protein